MVISLLNYVVNINVTVRIDTIYMSIITVIKAKDVRIYRHKNITSKLMQHFNSTLLKEGARVAQSV
jgi:hypothetical protein